MTPAISACSLLFLASMMLMLNSCEDRWELVHNAERKAECIKLQAQIKALDKEIELRLNDRYDIKWRGQAVGIATPLYNRMLEHGEKIIQARVRRAELYYLAQQIKNLPCTVSGDLWELTISKMDALRVVHAAEVTEG